MCIEVVGYLLEELRDAKNYEQFQKDVADANIFIGSLIFIEELAEKVLSSYNRGFSLLIHVLLAHACMGGKVHADVHLFRVAAGLPSQA